MARLTGGCQCGAVRFAAEIAAPASICHCRMCQKASGSIFAPLVLAETVEWTRGTRSQFASSDIASRGFCNQCGTPLTYESDQGVEIMIGALDDPNAVDFSDQVMVGGRHKGFSGLADLPVRQASIETSGQKIRNYQHPDRDTENEPPR
ncbi:GFA family protein [Paracoccus pacificus]|uniref:GFA family protein n=1 Tax=Paracoccus pacificus TaxID=1463598 RepID=A0ABW4RCI6_9RHOB